jgi:MOSC domain-containing protein YiiM
MNIPMVLERGFGHVEFGVYARVTTPGTIRPGDAITLISNLQREPLAARTQQPTIN